MTVAAQKITSDGFNVDKSRFTKIQPRSPLLQPELAGSDDTTTRAGLPYYEIINPGGLLNW